jgi:hypothetical protein
MSHFTTIPTRLVDANQVHHALADLGYTVQQGPVKVKGYQGQTTEAEFKISIQNSMRANSTHDIGFRRGKEGYELLADWWELQGFNRQAFLTQLQQRYAYHAARKALTAEGFTLVEEEQQENGTLHLVLRRAV